MSDSKIALLVRTRLSSIDDSTQISYLWAQAVKRRFEENNWRVIDVAIADAVRANVEEHLQSSGSIVFLFYGHGEEDRMIGQDGNALIDLDSRHLLKGQRVHAVACWTAEVLGRESKDVVRYYLGYERQIFIGAETYAPYLEKCVNKGILVMLDSSDCSIEQARQHTVDEYEHWIEHFSIGAKTSMNELFFATALLHNRDALAQVFGNRNVTLTD